MPVTTHHYHSPLTSGWGRTVPWDIDEHITSMAPSAAITVALALALARARTRCLTSSLLRSWPEHRPDSQPVNPEDRDKRGGVLTGSGRILVAATEDSAMHVETAGAMPLSLYSTDKCTIVNVPTLVDHSGNTETFVKPLAASSLTPCPFVAYLDFIHQGPRPKETRETKGRDTHTELQHEVPTFDSRHMSNPTMHFLL